MTLAGARRRSDRDREQGVDLAAVENDFFAGELPLLAAAHDPIDIAAGGEDHHVAFLHRADDEKVGFEIDGLRGFARSMRIDETRWR